MTTTMRSRDSRELHGEPGWRPLSPAEDRVPFANLQLQEDELPRGDADDDEELDEEDEDVEDER